MLFSASKSICFSPSPPPQLLLERAAAAGRSIRPAVWSSCQFVALYDSLCACGCSQGQGRRRRGRAASRQATFLIVEDDGKEDLSEAEKVLISTI